MYIPYSIFIFYSLSLQVEGWSVLLKDTLTE